MTKPSVKVGDRFTTNEGYEVEVVEYRNANAVVIRFDDEFGHIKSVRAGCIKRGQVKNPYHKATVGVGFIGDGIHKPTHNGKITRPFSLWVGMIKRCYSKESLKKRPTYEGCSVCDQWHNFQNFAEWYYRQPNCDSKAFDLDKDLLVIGNKTYSADTCSFVPHEINSLLNKYERGKGDYPLGVRKRGNGYEARLRMEGEHIYLGIYHTVEEAFSAYRKARELHVKSRAEKYKNVLHPTVYSNLMNWNLEDLEGSIA